ncbi:MAG: ferritin-like domain-containing protein [Hydrogenophaga sp.]|jgi:uncharacterized ferritin-like protein (DUF455 family)|nr:ferritin-like domain-containing protein [Hydrogenophaga sp.]
MTVNTHAQHASLRQQALAALCMAEPASKQAAAHALQQTALAVDDPAIDVDAAATLQAPPGGTLPGRPASPRLVRPGDVPQRSPFTTQGLAALLHAIAHIEFNAINLALDAVWRFADMPAAYYRDWIRVADEEALHFGLIRQELQALGHDYGDFDAHDGLWDMCVKTQDDVTARMALVPRTLEARGLDATPLIQARLRQVATPASQRAIGVLDIILRDEIGHVAVGNRWYAWLCERQSLQPVPHYRHLTRLHRAPRLRPPFNAQARLAAGFSQQDLDELLTSPGGTGASRPDGSRADNRG